MRAEMALAKLKVKNIRLDTGAGGIAELTPQDIAGGLAGCPAGPYYLGLYKYAGDRSVLNTLEKYVFAHIGSQGIKQELISRTEYLAMGGYLNSWHNGETGGNTDAMDDTDRKFCKTIHQLARLLVDDITFENRHRACGGTGVYQYRVCRGCGGTGRRLASSRHQARFLNVSIDLWASRWQPLFDQFVPMIQFWEQRVISHLNRKLYDHIEHELAAALSERPEPGWSSRLR